MIQDTIINNKNHRLVPQLLAISIFAVFALFLWQGDKGFNLGDEGFLWYGVQRVVKGEVPLRDFKSYEPGRYYFSAALMGLGGSDGIMALRAAVAVFQAIGLFVGLWLIARAMPKPNLLYLLLAALTLSVWMFPRHKLFDITISIMLVGALAFLLANPTSRRFLLAGVCVGLAAVFGRNHGVYGIAGSLGAMAWLGLKNRGEPKVCKGLAIWSAGVVVGFSPILLMSVLVPGFALALWDDVYFFLVGIKSTNLPLPIPWPWRVDYAVLPLEEAIRAGLIGLLFMAPPLYGVAALVWATWQKLHGRAVRPEVVASSIMALVYTHFAYSRADIYHLAQGIFPFLLGCLVLIARLPRKLMWPLALLLCAVSLFVMSVQHPGWQAMVNKPWVKVRVSGNEIIVDPATASNIKLMRELVRKYAPNGRSFVVLPFWPSAYPLFGRKTPMWENFALFPRSRAFEMAEIERIREAKPGFVLYLDVPLDGREDRRFRNTHPLTHQYIVKHFDFRPDSPVPEFKVYTPKVQREK